MEETKDNVQRPFKGMVTDCSPIDQPKGTYRFALNAIQQAEGNTNFLSTEMSNVIHNALYSNPDIPNPTVVIGHVYMQNDEVCLFIGGYTSIIAILKKDGTLEIVVQQMLLEFDELYPISAVYRMRRNNQRCIYWVDDHNKPRQFNFDRVYDYYTVEAKVYLETHDSLAGFNGITWEVDSFNLLTSYDQIPSFLNTEVIDGGDIPSGSYSAAIQLVDLNLQPTEWITVSNPVHIYVDSSSINYSEIRGSRNTHSAAQDFGNASKSIRWTFGNLDPKFTYYRVAILQANQGDGNISKALVSSLISIDNDKFTYSGNDSDYTSTPITDIQISQTDIVSAAHIAQLENRLILAGIRGSQIDWCEFQASASLIKSEAIPVDIVLDDVDVVGNAKHPVDIKTPYLPGEVYSFGIVYVLADGTKSPVFHIPGRPFDTAFHVPDSGVDMDFYHCADENGDGNLYVPLHQCLDNDYWGIDGYDDPLVNTPIRHHKFPARTSAIERTVSTDIVIGVQVRALVDINYTPADFDIGTDYILNISYLVSGVQYSRRYVMGGDEFTAELEPIRKTLGTYPEGSTIYINWHQVTIMHDEEAPAPSVQLTNVSDYNYPITRTETKKLSTCYGIKFHNIINPYPAQVIGYEIVRNKRTDDDKLIVDNVLIGPLVNAPKTEDTPPANTNQYHAFGLLAPHIDSDSISAKGFYIFSPEHQFRNKKLSFDSIDVVGKYTFASRFVPTTVNTNTDPDNAALLSQGNGVYLNDVQAGTSFNTEYNKGEDPDGFDLQVLYRNSKFTYALDGTTTIPMPDNIHYLSACGYKTTDVTYFNATSDNKIIIGAFDTAPVDGEALRTLFDGSDIIKLYSANLLRTNYSAYNNFINRTYYKEHQNAMYFDGSSPVISDTIVNGDAYVTPMTINASTYYDTHMADRDKKKRTWQIILGSLMIVGGVIAAAVSWGSATAASIMAISYGITLITSGLEFNALSNMSDIHFESGLKVCLQDDDNKDANYKPPTTGDDDRFEWFTDRIQDIYFEGSINTALRSGLTAPTSDFVNSPSKDLVAINTTPPYNDKANASYEAYLISKYTILDREKNNGRLFLGFASAEFYDINLDYLRKNYEKSYFYLPMEYECCSSYLETYNNRVHYSEQSYQEEKLDNYRKFLPNNYRDIESEFGRITNLFRQGTSLFIHTNEALFHLPQNLQERVTQELVSFIGTGEFFSIPPRKTLGFGSKSKYSTAHSPFGVLYVSEHDKCVYMTGGAESVSIDEGMYFWLKENLKCFLAESTPSFPYTGNPFTDKGVGVHSVYDYLNKRFLITKIDYKPIQAYDYYDYGNQTPEAGTFVYDYTTGRFGTLTAENTIIDIPFSNVSYFENKSWTISYSLATKSWASFHSYLPAFYISTPNLLYSGNRTNQNIYRHNVKGDFLKYYGVQYPYIIELVSISHPFMERVWNHVSLYTEARTYLDTMNYVRSRDIFFTRMVAYNSRQSSGQQYLNIKSTSNNFMLEQTQDSNEAILVENREGKFSINDLRDLVGNQETPLFITDWSIDDFRESYPIDKIPNEEAIDRSKSWMQMESFRDKYVILRFIFDNFAEESNIELITNYSVENEQMSIR